jgi:tetratricopeptide (TPR) repeat protein
LKKAIWPLLERAAKTYKVPAARLGTQVLEAFLYFCERDSVPIRRAAVELARSSLRRSMPYHLHASVVLFRSILDRLDGDLGKSKARIGDFLTRNPQRPTTRRDHALRGRLHISQLENKIKSYDDDVPLSIYRWEAAQPLSHLDIEITSRLQGVAARFFQSVGDFAAARASLEQFLTLYTTNPIRVNTRRLIVGRLADIYCEMQEYPKVVEILQPELDAVDNAADRRRRPFRRLLLASVEANIGLGRLDEAEALLKELQPDDSVMQQPPELHDIHDQQLHMRRLLASARIAHTRRDYHSAVARWKFAREEVERMYTLQSGGGFTAATIHLSLAHAELLSEDVHAARHSWSAGMEILRSEKCEFWIPIVPTVWLQSIVTEVYELQGWPFRMMLPGGKPDVTWPRPPPEVVS